jgi:D-alanyl-D-alanine carboxypeptidase
MRLILTRIGILVRIGFVLVLAGVISAESTSASASTADKYAAIVIDANSGRVLYSRNSDSYRYPASLTKMMTLYLTFEAISNGDLSLDDPLTVSSYAANQAPSKLALKAGDTISVKECILALITKSANDAAVVLAERIGGTESDFAQKMTERAHKLGMSRTTFRNASGLPNTSQRTTARDLATLGQSLMRDFPQYFGLFSTADFTWNGRTIPNHDRLLESYPGTNGLKTGYTAASGFNLATSVQRHGYNLIGIVLGGRTAKARDDHMMQLLDMQFARLEGSPMLASREPLVAQLPSPQPRPDDATAGTSPSAPAPASPQNLVPPPTSDLTIASLIPPTDSTTAAPEIEAMAPIADPPAQKQPGFQKIAAAAVVPIERPKVAPKPAVQAASFTPVGDPIGDTIAALTSSMARVAPKPRPASLEVASLESSSESAPPASEGEGDVDPDADVTPTSPNDARVIDWLGNNQHWGIQIGAFAAMESAAARLNAAAALAPDQLKAATPAIVSTPTGGATIYKARFGPFEEKEARNACSILSSRGISCVPVKETSRSR